MAMRPLTRTFSPNRLTRMFGTAQMESPSVNTQKALDLEHKYGANNYHPPPVVIARGQGVHVWDADGKHYFDFLAAHGALNQGHCHPVITQVLKDQADTLTLTSRAFHNDVLGEYCEFMSNYFNYPRVLPMNTGVEACYSTLKIARKWGYEVKGIPHNEGRLVFAGGNFWGRSFGAISASTDAAAYHNFGPLMPNFDVVPYNDIVALTDLFEKQGEYIAAYMCEPIQGEAGVVIPDKDYLKQVRQLCNKYNILWIADEVQCGIGRSGRRLCVDWDFDIDANTNNGPDIISLGKSISGGVFPVSAAITRTDEIMDVLTPGTHGSTYGGNPLGCKVAMTALTVLKEEGMIENSEILGKVFLDALQEMKNDFSVVKLVRGKGLFCAMELDPEAGIKASTVCNKMIDMGLLIKAGTYTNEYIMRMAPPLIITQIQLEECLEIMRKALKSVN